MCGERVKVFCPNLDCNASYEKEITRFCMSRDCTNPKCVSARQYKYDLKIATRLNQMTSPRFLTLTFKGSHLPTQDTFDRINQCWRAMAQWMRRNHVLRGYIKVIEAGLRQNGQWFFHLHTAVDLEDRRGYQVKQKDISDTWYRITGDSYICWIVNIDTEFTEYFTKYLVKGYGTTFGKHRKLITYWGKYEKVVKGKQKCPSCGGPLYYHQEESLVIRKDALKPQLVINDFTSH